MNTNETRNKFEIEYATERGNEALKNVEEVLKRALSEVQIYRKGFEERESLKDKANQLNWTINYCAANILGNLRLDLVADAQAALARLDSAK